jgi:hypothetical protein
MTIYVRMKSHPQKQYIGDPSPEFQQRELMPLATIQQAQIHSEMPGQSNLNRRSKPTSRMQE